MTIQAVFARSKDRELFLGYSRADPTKPSQLLASVLPGLSLTRAGLWGDLQRTGSVRVIGTAVPGDDIWAHRAKNNGFRRGGKAFFRDLTLDPRAISGLRFFYHGDDAATDVWPDRSGADRAATQPNVINQMGITPNALYGHSAVSATATARNYILPAGTLEGLSEGTVVTLYKKVSSDVRGVIMGYYNPGADERQFALISDSSEKLVFYATGTTGDLQAIDGSTHDGSVWNVIGASFKDGEPLRVFLNGVEASSYDIQDTATSMLASHSTRAVLGTLYEGFSSYKLNGDLAAALFYDRAISTKELATLTNYIKYEWNLTNL